MKLCVITMLMWATLGAGEPIDMRFVAVQAEQTTVIAADTESYSLTVIEDVTLKDGTILAAGDAIYIGDVIVDGAVRNDGITDVWVSDEDGWEYQVPPGALMIGPCMKRCSMSGCPKGLGAHCHSVVREGKLCCVCDCEAGPYPQSCECEVHNPA